MYFQSGKITPGSSINYHTSLPVLFGVKKYADALWLLVKERGINVNLRSNLVEVDSDKKVAKFANLDKPDEPLKSMMTKQVLVAIGS